MPEHTPFYAFQTYVNSGVPRFLSQKHNNDMRKQPQKVVSHPVCQSSTCVAAQSKSLFHVLKRAFPRDNMGFST